MSNLTKKDVSVVHRHIPGSEIQAVRNAIVQKGFDSKYYKGLQKNLGIILRSDKVRQMAALDAAMRADYSEAMDAMDALQPSVTTASITTPIQFLQKWLPGFVDIMTDIRNIDEITGITIAGEWHFKEIIQGVRERLGLAIPYGDYTAVPRVSYNVNYVRRSIINFEQGMQVGVREEMIASEIGINDAAEKREACGIMLEVSRNQIGFSGYNNGLNLTYGLLNDPNLPSYQTFPVKISGNTHWSGATFLEIQADVKLMISGLRTTSGGNIDPKKVKITMAVATSTVDFLSTTSEFGESVTQWMKEAYPNIRVVDAPELIGANGGANVVYFFADKVNDSSTDGGQAIIQAIQTKFMVVGVSKQTKGIEEDYSNGTAGVFAKRPVAIQRWSGN